MTITKQNENYTISDLMESGWKMEGNVMFEMNGALTLHVSISNENNFVADIHYNKPLEGNIHLGINSLEENRSRASEGDQECREWDGMGCCSV